MTGRYPLACDDGANTAMLDKIGGFIRYSSATMVEISMRMKGQFSELSSQRTCGFDFDIIAQSHPFTELH